MELLSLLLLIAGVTIACGYFKSQDADLWGLKGAIAGVVLSLLVRWGIPILWRLLNLVFFLLVVAGIIAAVVIGFKILAKHAD
ncbi:hypothetical protein HY635_03605 [Candidatus Uhrbacteria bacterium]|nr:hypothetical protein [Candidatus Uhrbacteria bacterium]